MGLLKVLVQPFSFDPNGRVVTILDIAGEVLPFGDLHNLAPFNWIFGFPGQKRRK